MREIIREFGLNAGIVWNELNSCGSVTERDLLEKTGLSTDSLHAAIGWLARENKICKDGDFFKLGETNLTFKIGKNAGILSKFVDSMDNDVNKISRLTNMEEKEIFSALGWLAREGRVHTMMEFKGDELKSARIEIDHMQSELESLNADIETRNQIIKEMTKQLTEKQTQFVENIGIVERLQMELEQNQNKIEFRNNDNRSVKINIDHMQSELESLNADIETRNQIIKEMTKQLTEKQTQFVENIGIVERLQMELEQNQNKIEEMNEELNKRTNDITQLQRELGNNLINSEITTSKLTNKDVSELVEEDGLEKDFNSNKKLENCDELNIFQDVSELSKTKKFENDEST